jgi:integrase
MARNVRSGPLESRTSRSKLPSRNAPYWCVLSPSVALGYRKGARGRAWLARLHDDETGRRLQEKIGKADDTLDADGRTVLSFPQAQAKVREWAAVKAREMSGEVPSAGPYTVADAIRDYLNWFDRHRKGGDATRFAVNAFILPALGEVDTRKLTRRRIEDWLHALAHSPARLRTGPGAPQRFRDGSSDPEAPRRRRATANRVLTILKAALNHALKARQIASDDAWRHVQRFGNVDAARPRYLSDDEARRLVNACDADFRPMVQAALLTGMRYGELAALRVADFNQDAGTLEVRVSKSGKSRHVHLTEEGQAFLKAATAGKRGDVLVLTRPDGKAWGRSHQFRPMAEACERGCIAPSASFHAIRHTYASRLVMKGVPLFVVAAQLGHRDTRMVEHHYGHMTPSYVADTIRAAFDPLGIVEQGNIAAIR